MGSDSRKFRWKRVLSALLIMAMIAPSMQQSTYAANNIEDTDTLVRNSAMYGAPGDPDDAHVLQINDEDAYSVTVPYGDEIRPSLTGGEALSDIQYQYIAVDDYDPYATWNKWEGSETLEPGSYYISWMASQGGVRLGEDDDKKYTMTVTKAKLGTPNNVRWDASKMKWDAVTTTTTGTELPAGCVKGYMVEVFKDNQVVESLPNIAVTQYDNFAQKICHDENKRSGVYTFKVIANINDAFADHYVSSEESADSNPLTAPSVQVVGSDGVTAVSPSDAIVLVPGSDTYSSNAISATYDSTVYAFIGWTGEGFSFEGASSASTTVTIDADYSGSLEAQILASVRDTKGPDVTDPEYKAPGQIKASATDNEDGVFQYAFSKESDKANVTSWSLVDNPASGTINVDFDLTESGSYYFYAMDKVGNATRSKNPIQVTKISLHDSYEKDEKQNDENIFVIGTTAPTLPEQLRKGYAFDGWFKTYDNGEYSDQVTDVEARHDGEYDLYAKWTEENLDAVTVTNVSKEYDGKNAVLAANHTTDLTGALSYKWEKITEQETIVVSEDDKVNVKEVADSGDYQLTVSLKDTAGNTLDTKVIEHVTVAITPKALTVCPKEEYSIYYGEDIPTFALKYEGLADSDKGLTEEELRKLVTGSITCDYHAGDPADDYAVVLSGFCADNYIVTPVNGNLKVLPLSGEIVVERTNPTETFVYDNTQHCPAVRVYFGEKLLTAEHYTVTYENNVKASEHAIVKVTLKGNYSGEKTLEFTINKAVYEPTVVMNGWTYSGVTSCQPTLSSYSDDITNADVIYHYATQSGTDLGVVEPTDAGEYTVYAEIPETENYEGYTTDSVDFVIAKKEITIKSESQTFNYDGAEHSNSHYIVEGTFVGGQGFSSITVSGTVKEVTDDSVKNNNTISYVLNSKTKASNYDIKKEQGTLKVLPRILNIPGAYGWHSSKIGTARWVAVTQRGMQTAYNVVLYAHKDDIYSPVSLPETIPGVQEVNGVSVLTTTDTSFDFTEVIRAHATNHANDGLFSYCFTIQTIPGTNTGDTDVVGNCVSSAVSAKSGDTYVTKVTITKDDESVKTAKFTEGDVSSKFLLQGETFQVFLESQDGYLAQNLYEIIAEEDTGKLSIVNYPESYDSTHGWKYAEVTAAKVGQSVAVTAHATGRDYAPEIHSFSARNAEDLHSVYLDFTLWDSRKIVAYAIAKTADASKLKDSDWVVLPEAEQLSTVNKTVQVTEPGTYYVFAKDDSDSIASWPEDAGQTVYQITFNDGEEVAEGSTKQVTGTMAPILRVKDSTITLPTNGYTYPGYTFQNWKGTSGTYNNEDDSYAANTNETLTAKWTNAAASYKVNYFYMKTDGTYSETPDDSKTFHADYGTVVTPYDEGIQQLYVGFAKDVTKNDGVSLTVTEHDHDLNIYYARNKYRITFQWTEPESDKIVSDTEDNIYYGAAVATLFADKKSALQGRDSVAGYTFVGWTYEEDGQEPATMPNHNVTATGHFLANDTKYSILYNIQDVDAETGELLSTYTRYDTQEKGGVCGTTIDFAKKDALEIEGFTFEGIKITQVNPSSLVEKPELKDSVENIAVTDDATNKLCINVYYTRNVYNVTLNVWIGNVGAGDPGYQKIWTSIPYQADVAKKLGLADVNAIQEYEKDQWITAENAEKYTLLDYASWSTGTPATTMPAGDIVITRQYVLKTQGEYRVIIYLEDENGNYVEADRFGYSGYVGQTVSIAKEADKTTDICVDPESLQNGIHYGQHYTLSTATEYTSAFQGTITDTKRYPEQMLVLKVYYERKAYTTNFTYYYNNNGEDIPIATAQKTMKWGHKYNCEPLALFGSSENGVWSAASGDDAIQNVARTQFSVNDTTTEVADADPFSFDFKTNGYVVSYASYYVEGNSPHWPANDLDTVASLGNTHTTTMGQGNTSYVRVYYTKAEPKNQYCVEVGYNPNSLDDTNATKFVNLTHQINGVDYTVWLANEAYFYKDAVFKSSALEAYPGLAQYQAATGGGDGHYEYNKGSDNIKAGYTVYTGITADSGKTYFVNEAEKKLYIAFTDNRFFYGNFTGYTYLIDRAKGDPGMGAVYTYLDAYKTAHADNPAAVGARIYDHSFGSTRIFTPSVRFAITFTKGDVYTLTYVMNGAKCVEHKYAAGKVVSGDELTCKHEGVFAVMPGYHIEWFTDANCTVPTNGATITMDGDKTIYGQQYRNIIKNNIYTYYELPNPITTGEGTISFITEKNVGGIAGVTSKTNDNTVPFTNALGKSEDVDLTTTTYEYDGVIVMQIHQVPTLSFQDLSVSAADYLLDDVKYDDANSNNMLKGFVQTDAIGLHAYYIRDKYTFTLDKNLERSNNPETKEYRVNETIAEIPVPVNPGYHFAGWKWYKKTGDAPETPGEGGDGDLPSEDGYVEWTEGAPSFPLDKQGEPIYDSITTMRMPNFHVKAQAIWAPGTYDQTVIHYFESTSSTFENKTIASMMESGSAIEVSVSYEEKSYVDGLLYSNGGVSFVDNGKTYYFTSAKAPDTEDGSYLVNEDNLSAIVETVKVVQDVKAVVSGLIWSDSILNGKAYEYVYTVRKYDTDNVSLSATDTYENKSGMTLEYYYKLKSYTISTEAYAYGHGKVIPGVTITTIGGGNYFYAGSTTLTAAWPKGYAFKGWFKTEAVAGKPALESTLPTPLTTSATYTIDRITEACSYTAIVEAEGVSEPICVIDGTTSLTYGYTLENAPKVTVNATFGEDAFASSYIAGYQWFIQKPGAESFEKIEGATKANYAIPAGWDAGEYKFKCVVTAKNRDTDLSVDVTTAEHTLTIGQDNMEVYSYSYVEDYDGLMHGIEMHIYKPTGEGKYTVYYSEGTELTAENFKTSGSITLPKYKDVAVDEAGKTIERRIYYYIKSHDPNYQDKSGYSYVLIQPKKIHLDAGTAHFDKVYDGVAEVQGSLENSASDYYKLVHTPNLYTIEEGGLVAADKDKKYILSCDAAYNDAHHTAANAVELSNISLLDTDNSNQIDYNYYFEAGYTFKVSGLIDQVTIPIVWNALDFTYDGTQKCPAISDSMDKSMIPECDRVNLEFRVSGAQVNVGTYAVSANMQSTDENTKVSDYILSNARCDYTISAKAVSVGMVEVADITYDGEEHTLTEVETKNGTALVAGHSVTASPDSAGKNVGTYTIKPVGIKIHDEHGVDVTSNYAITNVDANMVIQKRKVTASNIKVSNKAFDGNDTATVDVSAVIFDNIIAGDTLALDVDKVSAKFEDPTGSTGSKKNVRISIADGALIGSSADNYLLDVEKSTLTTSADINQKELLVKADDVTAVYGQESVAFTYTLSGFEGTDTAASIGLTGSVVYKISTSSHQVPEAYTQTTAVGDQYMISVDVSGLSCGNYSFKADTTQGKLTVTPRPIAVKAADRSGGKPAISKTYDGTTEVLDTIAYTSDYVYDFVPGQTQSGLVNSDTINLTFNAAYADANVGAPNVQMTGLSIDNANYELVTTAFTIPGAITKKTLTIQVKDLTANYGDYDAGNTPAYEVEYSGFVEGEDSSVLTGTLAYACAFDPSDAKKRNVNTTGYEITASGLTETNYTYVYQPGKLIINPATITITTNVDGATKVSYVYGDSKNPVYGYVHDGMKYGESFKDKVTVEAETKYTQTIEIVDAGGYMIASPSGTYDISVNTSNWSADNYVFAVEKATVTITKHSLKIDGISVGNKVYDGTTDVPAGNINLSGVLYDGLLTRDEDQKGQKPLIVSGTFAQADAANGVNIALNITLNDYLNARYEIQGDGSQKSATADITKRTFSITAQKVTMNYGSLESLLADKYDAVFERATAGSDTGLVLDHTADKTRVTFACTYKDGVSSEGPATDKGDYPNVVTVSAFTFDDIIKGCNYTPNYIPGDLEVTVQKLPTPEPVWSSTIPGTVHWQQVDSVVGIAPDHYELRLYKDNGNEAINSTAIITVSADTANADKQLTYDFSSLIKDKDVAGAGAYQVGIIAVPTVVNNVGYKNVSNSDEGKSENLYAANVNFKFAADTKTQNGKTETIKIDDVAPVSGVSTYLMIAGESNVTLEAEIKNATGYEIKDVTAKIAGVATTNLVVADKTDSARTGVNYASTVSLARTHNSAADIDVELVLHAKPAKLQVVVAPALADPEKAANVAPFGYTAATAPTLVATVAHEGASETTYHYTYKWYLRDGKFITNYEDVANANLTTYTNQWKPNTGLHAATYPVVCLVTVTRDDNGETASNVYSFDPVKAGAALNEIIITRAEFHTEVKMDGWTFGQVPSNASLDATKTIPEGITAVEHPGLSNVVYSYKKTTDGEDAWSTTKPSDAGTYAVKAYIPESPNYSEFTTQNTCQFTISPTKLPNPTNVSMGESNIAAYGLLKWDAVTAPTKNGTGRAEDEVAVTYQVTRYKVNGTEETEEYQYTPISANGATQLSLDVTQDVQVAGVYRFYVQAISGEPNNCADSDKVKIVDINMGASITGQDHDETTSAPFDIQGASYERVYNGKTVTMTAYYEADSGAATYEWYKGKLDADGSGCVLIGTGKTLDVSHVADSGIYTCKISDGNLVFTPIFTVNITKRTVVLTSQTATKVYDGTPLTAKSVTDQTVEGGATSAGFVAGEGADYVFDSSATQTDVKSDVASENKTTNSFTYTLKAGTTANDYNISTVFGQLSVTKRNIATAYGQSKLTVDGAGPYVYNATAFTPEPTVTDLGLDASVGASGVRALVEGGDFTYSYANNVNVGTADVKPTITVTGKGNYEGSVSTNFVINKRPVTFTGNSDHTLVYNGSNQTVTGVTAQAYVETETEHVGLVAGHTHNVEATVSRKNVGTSTGTITAKDNVQILSGSVDVTANYDITTTPGQITISQISAADMWSIALENDTYTYDGNNHYINKVPTASAATGSLTGSIDQADVTYGYRFAEDALADSSTPYVADLSSLVKKDAGTYSIQVKASNPNYTTDATTTATLTIQRKAVTVTTEGDEKAYDGSALTKNVWSVDGIVDGETYGFVVTGTQTDYGESNNTYTMTWAEVGNTYTAKAANYTITNHLGKLKVNKRTITVTITGNQAEYEYDGTAKTVSGYTWETDEAADSKLYTADDMEFSAAPADGETAAQTSITETNVKVDGSNQAVAYPMNLRAACFTNKNDASSNYAVTFVVNDGYLKIVKTNQTAPVLTVTHVEDTSLSGQIHDVTTAMEYRKKGETTFTMVPADGSVTGLDAGVYEVRYAETNNKFASPITEVEIKYVIKYVDNKPVEASGSVTNMPTANGLKEKGTTFTLAGFVEGGVPTLEGYTFAGWSTDSAATQPTYTKPSHSYTEDAPATMYAVWKADIAGITANVVFHFTYSIVDEDENILHETINEQLSSAKVVLTQFVEGEEPVEMPGTALVLPLTKDTNGPVEDKETGSAVYTVPAGVKLPSITADNKDITYKLRVYRGDGSKTINYQVVYGPENTPAKGQYDVDLYYRTVDFVVKWKVEANALEVARPEAIRVKVLYNTVDSTQGMKVITQHNTTSVTCDYTADEGNGYYHGSYMVWMWQPHETGEDYEIYYYAFVISSYKMNGEWVDVTPYYLEPHYFTDSLPNNTGLVYYDENLGEVNATMTGSLTDKKFQVSFADPMEGYQLESDVTEVDYKGQATITYTTKEGYTMGDDFAILATVGEVGPLVDNGDGTITVTVTNITNDTVISASGVRDLTAPTGTISVNEHIWDKEVEDVVFKIFYKTEQKAKIKGIDLGSGIDKIYYYISHEPMTETQVRELTEWTEGDEALLEENGYYVVYGKITDKAGNCYYVSTDGIVIDNRIHDVQPTDEGIVITAVDVEDKLPPTNVSDFPVSEALDLITEDELEEVKGGTIIRIELRLKDINDAVPVEDRKEIENLAKQLEGEVGQPYYVDISLFKQIGVHPPVKLLSSGTHCFTIGMDIPEKLINRDTTMRRTYRIARVHWFEDGSKQTEFLDTTQEEQKLIFDADMFSTYAIVYTDVKVEVPTPTPEPSATPTVTPEPSATPTVTPEPSASPEVTPEPSATPEVTPEPSATPEVTPEPSATPTVNPEEPTPTPSDTPDELGDTPGDSPEDDSDVTDTLPIPQIEPSPAPTGGEGSGEMISKDANPQTGDTNHPLPYILLMLMSAAGFGLSVGKKRKRK